MAITQRLSCSSRARRSRTFAAASGASSPAAVVQAARLGHGDVVVGRLTRGDRQRPALGRRQDGATPASNAASGGPPSGQA